MFRKKRKYYFVGVIPKAYNKSLPYWANWVY